MFGVFRTTLVWFSFYANCVSRDMWLCCVGACRGTQEVLLHCGRRGPRAQHQRGFVAGTFVSSGDSEARAVHARERHTASTQVSREACSVQQHWIVYGWGWQMQCFLLSLGATSDVPEQQQRVFASSRGHDFKMWCIRDVYGPSAFTLHSSLGSMYCCCRCCCGPLSGSRLSEVSVLQSVDNVSHS